jgi:hypothetical protein
MDIVCGDALGVSCGTWIAVWNGAIGAFVAAVLGGAVALVVVRLTNAQQRRGVERTVEIAAVADLVAAIEELEWAVHVRVEAGKPFDPSPYMVPMRAAITRLWMSSHEAEPLAELVLQWPLKLGRLVSAYTDALARKEPYASEIAQSISDVSTAAMVGLPRCYSKRTGIRADAVAMLKQTNKHLITDVDRFRMMLDPNKAADSSKSPARNGGVPPNSKAT